jgi:hypothetical protein
MKSCLKSPVPARAPGTPFPCTEDAWFWTIGALRSRREGARHGGSYVPRPCEPDDVVRCLDSLYQQRRIDLSHARVLRVWGERQMRPDRLRARHGECQLWQEAMARLEPVLRRKGIVA